MEILVVVYVKEEQAMDKGETEQRSERGTASCC